jgi:energy-coupling factor transporter ATP-binding protein EcfA2
VDPAFRDGLYVGRTKEAERIQSELELGHNLVLTGPFGIGRTTLLRHLARELKPTWRFVFLDGSQTPGSLCERLLDVWAPERPKALRKRTHPWTVERRLLPGLLDREPRSVAVVLDDLGKVTHPKLDFLRWLQGLGRVRIIVVTERFLDEGPLMHLRAVLYPAPLLTLGPLSNRPAQAFFEGWAQLHGLDWEPAAIHGLVLATRGYPTGMWEAAQGATALSPPRGSPWDSVGHPGPIPESEG